MSAPSIPQTLRAVYAGAPTAVRRSVITGLGAWLVVMVLQGFDSADETGPIAVAEFLSALCGSAGGALLALAGILNSSAEMNAGERRRGPDADGYRRIVLAIPAVGFAAGALLAAAVALMIIRAMLGAALPFVILLTSLFTLLVYFAASTVVRATRVLYTHAQLEAQDAADARFAAGEAKLTALQARMNPHFLFNALNTVASLVRTQPAVAERVTENLSNVLRMTLQRSVERMSTVASEVAYIRTWLAVEHERWGQRLHIDWDIEAGTEQAALPPLVLQPLVENALRHGLAGRIAGGTIAITVGRSGSQLSLRVNDDGVGFPAAYEEGTGLGTLRQRLASLYGDAGVVLVETRSSGAAVVVRIPYEEADARADRR